MQIPTVSNEDPSLNNYTEFIKLNNLFNELFPKVYSYLERIPISNYSLVFKWKGQNSSLKPILLMAHQDVVPIVDEDQWLHPPFGGVIADGYIWGRGAMDDKVWLFFFIKDTVLLAATSFESLIWKPSVSTICYLQVICMILKRSGRWII
jgi:carboxypeptidase PM20D1